MTTTTLGYLLLSTMQDAEIENTVRRCNIASGLPVPNNVAEILDEIHAIRERNHAYGENTPMTGGATLGVLLPRTIQGQPVAIGCSGVLERVRSNRELYLDILRDAVSTITG